MRVMILRCGAPQFALSSAPDSNWEILDCEAVPTRKELKALDAAAREILPEDPTPSLDEIAAQPDVAHLGAPAPAPQPVPEALRVIVIGTDAALSAVITRLMRADTMWVEVAYVPVEDTSAAAQNWGLPQNTNDAFRLALEGVVAPVPTIRNDAGQAVAGSATISQWNPGAMTGEIIVDDHVLVRQDGEALRGPQAGVYGAKLVPMVDAPGIVAAAVLIPTSQTPAYPPEIYDEDEHDL
ncbi:hypothetical protein [Corynebacterium sp. 11254D000AR]